MSYTYILIASWVTALIVTPLVTRLAKRFTCLDYPNERKCHLVPTPRWGGFALLIGILPVFAVMHMDRVFGAYFLAALLILAVGMLDDCRPLNWKVKLTVSVIAITIFIYTGGISIDYLGTYGMSRIITLGKAGIPFTYIAIIGVTNAMNLIDGLNGLASGISFIGFVFIGLAAVISGNHPLALFSFAFAGALLGFLRYNFPRASIFMGDSGSLFLGFTLAVFSIILTQERYGGISPMYPVLVLLIPIFDTLRVMLLRIFAGRNPFLPDMSHIHHLAIRSGMSNERAVVLFWMLTIILSFFALLLIPKSSTPYAVIALLFSTLLSIYANTLDRLGSRRE